MAVAVRLQEEFALQELRPLIGHYITRTGPFIRGDGRKDHSFIGKALLLMRADEEGIVAKSARFGRLVRFEPAWADGQWAVAPFHDRVLRSMA